MRKPLLLFVCLLCPLVLLAEVCVTNVTVKPRWPWNGLVDVTYTVEGEPGQYYSVSFSGHDQVRDEEIEMRSMSGLGGRTLVSPGTYTATWDAARDLPKEFHTPSFVVDVEAAAVSEEPLYLVVDLSKGPSASHYPVGYALALPDIQEYDACRTTELWLRRIPAGTFMMGSPMKENGRNAATEFSITVILTQEFYIGVFECTQSQYELVMGANPSMYQGATRPVERVTYNALRGGTPGAGAGWPEAGHVVDAGCASTCRRRRSGSTPAARAPPPP